MIQNNSSDNNNQPLAKRLGNEGRINELADLKDQVAARDAELIRIKRERDFEIQELNEIKAQLEDAKNVLEVRVSAKTKELRDLTGNLEKEIEARTRELQEKVKESEQSRVALMNMLEDMEDLRRRAEEEKEKTLAIITNFADGLLFFDSNDDLALANPQIETCFAVSKEDILSVIGKKISELEKVAGFKPLVELVAGSLKKISRKELFLSEKLVLEVSSLEVSSRHGKIGTLVTIHDITREKTVERMKTEFVSIAAHQLRTPISAIKWTLRMILDGDLGPINEEQRDFLDKTYKSNERMINLINDLLNVTRIEEGRHLYNLILVNLEDIVSALVGTYSELFKQKRLTLEFEKPKKALPQVKIDVEKMRLVVSNLIENAIKYTPAGGKISVSVGGDDANIKISVRDTGMGILKDQEPRIFTKYFRGSNAIRMETEGTGLGLFIAKNIVETHGGKIDFVSREGEGTIFTFLVPVAKN
ncbi:MAG: ATP-binding protein [Candidatus Paceibacterota bacterium]